MLLAHLFNMRVIVAAAENIGLWAGSVVAGTDV